MSQQDPCNPNQQPQQPQYQGQPYQGQQQPFPGAPAGYPGGPVPPQQKKSWFARHKALSIVGGVFLFFVVVGIAAGGGDDSSSNSTDTAASTPAKVDAKPADKTDDKPAAPTKTKEKAPAAKPKPAAPKPKEYVNGDYVVGEDIPAGTYTTPGAEKGLFEVCMVSTDPTSDSVFPQLKSANADERIIITLKKADGVVSISGCEPLTPRK